MPWIKIVYENIQWIFSGIGVTLISIFLGKQITKSLKNRQTGKKGSVNISMEENNSIGNIQTQNAAKNSTNYQINGNYNTGLSYQDARDISLDVFKANAKTYTDEAKKIIEERAAEISEDIFKTIYIEIPVAIKKLVEPAVQEAILNAQKAYAKNASPVLKIQLVELIKQRLQAEENDIEQIVLDEALSIIPKLNSKHMDILSLHFSMLKHRNNQLCNRESFFDYIEKEIQPFYFPEFTADSLYAHLQYAGCTTILSEGSTYKRPRELFKLYYEGLFPKGFSKEEFDLFMSTDTSILSGIIRKSVRDPQKYQLDGLTEGVLEYLIDEKGYTQYKDQIVNFYRQTTMSAEEIVEDIATKYPFMKQMDDEWEKSRTFKAMSLTSVGIAIGILNYNIKTGKQELIKDYVSF